jgi:hypothetical protein
MEKTVKVDESYTINQGAGEYPRSLHESIIAVSHRSAPTGICAEVSQTYSKLQGGENKPAQSTFRSAVARNPRTDTNVFGCRRACRRTLPRLTRCRVLRPFAFALAPNCSPG